MAALEKDRAVFDSEFEAEAADLRDPEAMYYWSLMAAYLGDVDRTVEMLKRAVGRGWWCYQALATEPWLDVVRSDPRFTSIFREAEARHREAAAAFISADGDRLLGMKQPVH